MKVKLLKPCLGVPKQMNTQQLKDCVLTTLNHMRNMEQQLLNSVKEVESFASENEELKAKLKGYFSMFEAQQNQIQMKEGTIAVLQKKVLALESSAKKKRKKTK